MSDTSLLVDPVARALLDSDLVAVALVSDGLVAFANQRFVRHFGEVAGQSVSGLAPPRERERLAQTFAQATWGGPAVRQVLHLLRPGAGEIQVELAISALDVGGAPAYLVVASEAVAQPRAEALQLSYLAFVDPLTGLPNRAYFQDRVRALLLAARRTARPFAVVYGDLDGFKQVNDTLGHDAGDLVLQEVGRRLQGAIRDGDTAARLGGDEFGLLLGRITRREDAEIVAGRVVKALSPPIVVRGEAQQIGISVGIATWPENGADLDELCAAADGAMYEAKRGGKNRCVFARAQPAAALAHARFFEFTATHHVGVGLIDEQHGHLADLINQLGDDLKAGRELERLVSTLRLLFAFARHHFASEEGLMTQYGLDGGPVKKHLAQHRVLLEDLQGLSIDVDERSMVLTMSYLKDWLLRHIEHSDRKLAAALRSAGAT